MPVQVAAWSNPAGLRFSGGLGDPPAGPSPIPPGFEPGPPAGSISRNPTVLPSTVPPAKKCKTEIKTVTVSKDVPGSESTVVTFGVYIRRRISHVGGNVPKMGAGFRVPYEALVVESCSQRIDYKEVVETTTVSEVHSGPAPCPNRSYVMSKTAKVKIQKRVHQPVCVTNIQAPYKHVDFDPDGSEKELLRHLHEALMKRVYNAYPGAVALGGPTEPPDEGPAILVLDQGVIDERDKGKAGPVWEDSKRD